MRRVVVVAAVVLAGAILFTGMTLTNKDRAPQSTAAMADAQLIALATNTPEAQAFFTHYPNAAPSVDRSGRVAVDFRANGGTPGVRLRVFINDDAKVDGSFLECSVGQLIQEHVAEAARKGCPG